MTNPLFLAYAKATGTPDPDDCIERDRKEWPGGVMCGFILWMADRKSTWVKLNPKPFGQRTDEWVNFNVEKFHAWILDSEGIAENPI